jgi:hypothetical protein
MMMMMMMMMTQKRLAQADHFLCGTGRKKKTHCATQKIDLLID